MRLQAYSNDGVDPSKQETRGPFVLKTGNAIQLNASDLISVAREPQPSRGWNALLDGFAKGAFVPNKAMSITSGRRASTRKLSREVSQ